jgi:NAD(P)-dependent dehydrogenase (short-subunit alcohol dehydrogenase family)
MSRSSPPQINNSGISGVYLFDVMKDKDDWMNHLNVDLVGPLLASRLALTHWLRAKKQGSLRSSNLEPSTRPLTTQIPYLVVFISHT